MIWIATKHLVSFKSQYCVHSTHWEPSSIHIFRSMTDQRLPPSQVACSFTRNSAERGQAVSSGWDSGRGKENRRKKLPCKLGLICKLSFALPPPPCWPTCKLLGVLNHTERKICKCLGVRQRDTMNSRPCGGSVTPWPADPYPHSMPTKAKVCKNLILWAALLTVT